MFDLRQLRYFVAVAETLSFTRAAQRLHLSQPPLSQQIRALEDDLGVRLFDRNRRHVALTEPGRLFLDEARKILSQVDAARITATEAAAGHRGRLRLAYPASLSFHRALPQTLLRFSSKNQGVRVELHEMYTETQYAALVAGQIDVGFVRAVPKERSIATQVTVDIIDHEPLLLALPASHPLAGRKHIGLHEVASESFVIQPRAYSTTLYDTLVQMASAAGFRPTIRQEVQQVTGTLALVAAGVGMAVVPASLRAVHLPEVSMVNLDDDNAELLLAVARRKQNHSPALTHFLEAVTDCSADSTPQPD
ncbi:MAG TPA: LysR substrate-binding domain-containing protein [Oleiagrimonas sp.]|nr:LysR substrate-binding domain-containing protein [Oleiagrimonas sp.]